MGKYAASLDIKKAYRQIKVSHRDSMLRLSIWYHNLENMQERVIFKTATANFGDSQTSLALRVAEDKYIAANCKTKLGKLAAEDLFADNNLFAGQSKEDVLEAIVKLINLHKYYGMELKHPSHNLGSGTDYLGVSEYPNSNALDLTWNTQKATLEPIFHYHLTKKMKGVKNLVN